MNKYIIKIFMYVHWQIKGWGHWDLPPDSHMAKNCKAYLRVGIVLGPHLNFKAQSTRNLLGDPPTLERSLDPPLIY